MSYETDMRYLLSEIESLKRRLQFQERLETQVSAYGWIPAGETWTYAYSTTVTISGDKPAKYSKGMKVKLTQTTVKYFYITAVSYSAPNTTLTLTAGSDYTVANAAITSPYYSVVANPVGFPQTFNFTPVGSSYGGMTFTVDNIDIAKFNINEGIATFWISINGTATGTESDSMAIVQPFPLVSIYPIGYAQISDGGWGIKGIMITQTDIIRCRKEDLTNYSLGETKWLRAAFFVPI